MTERLSGLNVTLENERGLHFLMKDRFGRFKKGWT